MSELCFLSFGMSKDLYWFQDGWKYTRQFLYETSQFILEWMLEKVNLHAKCINFMEVNLLFLSFLMFFGCWTWNLTEFELDNQMVELWFVKFFSIKVDLFRFRLHFEESIFNREAGEINKVSSNDEIIIWLFTAIFLSK